jgi:4'-phosphopantetheinyl transferase
VARLTRVAPCAPFWSPPPAALVLDGDEVHVWRVDVRSAYVRRNDLWRVLARDERQKATELLFEDDRKRFVVSRGVLRVLLGRYLHTQPSSLEFGYNPHGKPFLAGASGVRFSTSHSHDLVLLAFVRGRDIGVDVEHIREDIGLDEIASRHFSTREVATLRSLPNSSRKKAFFACWTRKEAFAKAEGRGLTLPFNRFEVTLTPGEPAMLLNVEEDIREPSRWAMQQLIPDPGYAAALVVEDHTLRTSCWQYTG